MRTYTWVPVVLGLPFLASGCFLTPPSTGELGNVEVTYDEGVFGCLFGCDASEPMAADSNTFLVVQNDDELATDFEPFVVSSDNADILETITDGASDSFIRLNSHEPGQARVVFEEQTSGDLIDRFAIDVREIQRMEVNTPEFSDNLLVFVGGATTVYLDLLNGSAHLKGFGGVDYTVSGGLSAIEVTLTSALVDAIAQLFTGSTTEFVRIQANELGAGNLAVRAMRGDATLDIPVEVVDESRVARITVSDGRAEPGNTTSVSAAAFDANGDEIHDPPCEWTSEGADVTTSSPSRTSISATATIATTAEITCTVGSVSGSGTVTFAVSRY